MLKNGSCPTLGGDNYQKVFEITNNWFKISSVNINIGQLCIGIF